MLTRAERSQTGQTDHPARWRQVCAHLIRHVSGALTVGWLASAAPLLENMHAGVAEFTGIGVLAAAGAVATASAYAGRRPVWSRVGALVMLAAALAQLATYLRSRDLPGDAGTVLLALGLIPALALAAAPLLATDREPARDYPATPALPRPGVVVTVTAGWTVFVLQLAATFHAQLLGQAPALAVGVAIAASSITATRSAPTRDWLLAAAVCAGLYLPGAIARAVLIHNRAPFGIPAATSPILLGLLIVALLYLNRHAQPAPAADPDSGAAA